jgi:hypothetical protein
MGAPIEARVGLPQEQEEADIAGNTRRIHISLGGWPTLSRISTPEGAPPLSRFLRQGGDFDFLSHHGGHSCPGFFITNKLCEPSQTSSIAQCDNDPLMGKGRGVLVNEDGPRSRSCVSYSLGQLFT